MSKRISKIIRHGQPGTLDHAPQGTACFVPIGKEYFVYVQVREHESYPRWECMGVYADNYNKKQLKQEIDKFKTLKF